MHNIVSVLGLTHGPAPRPLPQEAEPLLGQLIQWLQEKAHGAAQQQAAPQAQQGDQVAVAAHQVQQMVVAAVRAPTPPRMWC